MSNDRSTVSFSREVSEDLRRLGRAAKAEGRLRVFADAANWIAEELERTPLEFGESREELGSFRFRCGFAGPLYVAYAVDDAERVVYIRWFALRRT